MNSFYLNDNWQALAKNILAHLQAQGKMLGTAESCTGGLVAAMLTEIPGSSAFFKGCIVAYHNSIKENILKVPAATLENFGAVSEETARAMALGAQKALDAHCAIAITGIAGPDGGSKEKPVGTVCLAWAVDQTVTSKTLHLEGDRRSIRLQSALAALAGLSF